MIKFAVLLAATLTLRRDRHVEFSLYAPASSVAVASTHTHTAIHLAPTASPFHLAPHPISLHPTHIWAPKHRLLANPTVVFFIALVSVYCSFHRLQLLITLGSGLSVTLGFRSGDLR